MYETGKDMNAKYRETSCGSLARQIVPENSKQIAIKQAPPVAV